MFFKKILLPVDGSEHSKKAVLYARGIARSQGAEVVLFHAYAPISELIGGDSKKELIQESIAQSEALIKPYKEILTQDGISFTEKIVMGRPSEKIIQTCEEEGCDGIVLGSRGLSDFEGLFVGSVCHQVLHLAKLPVLVVR